MRRLAALLGLLLTGAAPDGGLDAWPAAGRARIARAIATAPAGSFATFDADNTLWRHDLEESLLPWLENRGLIALARLDPLLKPVPVLPDETLYGYYLRLCALDEKICYPWIAQAFSGLTLATLKREVDAMMASGRPIPVRYRKDGRTVRGQVMPPAIFAGQRQLVAALRAHGIRVYVVTASLEELVRMVVSDPAYGLDVAAEDVVGVTSLLRDPATGAVTTARQEIAGTGRLDAGYAAGARGRLVLTASLWSPLTWQEGKVAAIQAYVDPVRRPMLAAGDSRSDWPMLFYARGLRIWVDKGSPSLRDLDARRAAVAAAVAAAGETSVPPARDNWLVVTQDALAASR